MSQTEAVLRALRGMRCPFKAYETDLHQLIGECFRENGIPAEHEYRLGPGCRIDWMADDTGIEIKKGKPAASKVREQLARYASFPQVGALVVVSQRAISLPSSIAGKPIYTICLNALWGVSLP